MIRSIAKSIGRKSFLFKQYDFRAGSVVCGRFFGLHPTNLWAPLRPLPAIASRSGEAGGFARGQIF